MMMMMMMMTVANRDTEVRPSTYANNEILYVPLEVTYESGFATALILLLLLLLLL